MISYKRILFLDGRLKTSPVLNYFGVPIVVPGATVGTVETRVPRAGLPRPTTSF